MNITSCTTYVSTVESCMIKTKTLFLLKELDYRHNSVQDSLFSIYTLQISSMILSDIMLLWMLPVRINLNYVKRTEKNSFIFLVNSESVIRKHIWPNEVVVDIKLPVQYGTGTDRKLSGSKIFWRNFNFLYVLWCHFTPYWIHINRNYFFWLENKQVKLNNDK